MIENDLFLDLSGNIFSYPVPYIFELEDATLWADRLYSETLLNIDRDEVIELLPQGNDLFIVIIQWPKTLSEIVYFSDDITRLIHSTNILQYIYA